VTLRPGDFYSACAVGQGWISNGHWLLRLERVKNAADYADVETAQRSLGRRGALVRMGTIDQPALAKILTNGDAQPWVTTAFLFDNRTQSRILRNGEQIAAIDNHYLRLVDLHRSGITLYSAAPDRPFRDAADAQAATFVVMPLRLGEAVHAAAQSTIAAVQSDEQERPTP
jgi:hypothetical protein